MALPTLIPVQAVMLRPEPLTPSAFAPFGTIIVPPISRDVTTYPTAIPSPAHPNHQPHSTPANQHTALKTSPISPLLNLYTSSTKPGTGLMSIFSSFPRQNTYTSSSIASNLAASPRPQLKLKLGILERHPYTTQTFCPFNYSSPSPVPSPGLTDDQTYMLIVVAPTLQNVSSNPRNPPDLTRIRAFATPLNDASSANMAVTYAPGTWHAPMIVLGSRRVDFLVTQFVNGIGNDDVQEVLIGSGPDEAELGAEERRKRMEKGLDSVNIEVDVSFARDGLGSVGEVRSDGMWKWKTRAKI